MTITAIIGSRNFNNYELLKNELDKMKIDNIISGGARGADSLARKYAKEKGINFKEYLADWDKHGKSAGYIRNYEIVNNCDRLIAFWDHESKGTKHSIDLAMKKGINVKIVRIEK